MRSKGRTGARGRARIVAPPSAAEIEKAERMVVTSESWLRELAPGNPGVKVWRARLRAAKAVIARGSAA